MTMPIRARTTRSWLLLSLVAGLLVGLMAEISIHPFGTAFRFSLGPVALAFEALFFSTLPSYLTGATAGVMVPLVHGAAALLEQPQMGLEGLLYSVSAYLPETYAYTLLGFLLYLFRVHQRTDRPLTLAALLTFADVSVNVVEVLIRGDLLRLLPSLPVMALVAVARALVALGAYYVLQEGVRARQWAEERQRYTHQLLFLSNLQTEAFFLQKSAAEMEAVMAKAHRLYRELGDQPEQPLALEIAKDIHEVKKDAQRTLAALFRLVETPELEPTMTFGQIVALVVDANQTYAETLGKQIQFTVTLKADFCTPRFGRWVSMLNNLVSNAIEACPGGGHIAVDAARVGDRFVLRLSDTGEGIAPSDWELVFSPGFSTKTNPVTGHFSSGIGLTHAVGLVQMMDGTIAVEDSGPGGTTFRLEVPWERIDDVSGKEVRIRAALSHPDRR